MYPWTEIEEYQEILNHQTPKEDGRLSSHPEQVKASAHNAGDLGSIPGSGRFPREGNGNPLQYSCLEIPMDREACWAIVLGVSQSRTQLSD